MPVIFGSPVYTPAPTRQRLAQKPALPTIPSPGNISTKNPSSRASSQAIETDSYTSADTQNSVPEPEATIPNRSLQSQLNILFDAIRHNNVRKLKKLPLQNIPLHARNKSEHNRTLLMVAAQAGNLPYILMLLSLRPLINLQDDLGNTALHLAVKAGHWQIVEKLLEKGADVTIRDSFFQTPLKYAAGRGNTAMIALLLKHGAPVDQTNNTGTTALMGTAAYGHYEATKQLLRNPADSKNRANPNLSNSNGTTALMMAAREGHFKVVRLLVRSGALLHLTNREGQNALMIARRKGHHDIADWLEKKARKFDYHIDKRPSLNQSQMLVTLKPKTREPETIIGFKVDRPISQV
ncbi:MAG: ankyrin repeat-containing protein [Vampirovibrio sp.]|jgi:ankyrin repeat protein|nr:ankyrin repeat-containing protein [Vampirovibrio sp.]